MNVPIAPIHLTQSSCSSMEAQKGCGCSRRACVILISLFELTGSLIGMLVYGYAAYVQPAWNHLVPVPQDLCNAKDIVRGVMFVFILLLAMEFFLSLYLFEAARNKNLCRIRFWLASMLTYLSMITVVIIGMELGGIRSPTMNAAAFINIFLRFLEIIIVYVYVEHEAMKERKLQSNFAVSTMTISTVTSNQQRDFLGTTTPPNSAASVAVPLPDEPRVEEYEGRHTG